VPTPHRRQRESQPGLKQAMAAYWRGKGVTIKSQVEKLASMACNRKLYGDFARIDQKLEQVRCAVGWPPASAGRGGAQLTIHALPMFQLQRMLPGADVVKIISNAPNLLVYDIETSIPPKLTALKRLLPGVNIVKIVASSPHLLTFNVEKNIAPKMQQLWKLLPGMSMHASHQTRRPGAEIVISCLPWPGANVVKIVSAAPNLLSYDVESSLAQKLDQLWKLLPGADVVKLISYAPTLLYHDAEASIAPKLKCVIIDR
jgi:hypothetical protein